MTIAELIVLLEEAAEEVGEDTEVRLSTQPNWPLAFNIRGIHCPDQVLDKNYEIHCIMKENEGMSREEAEEIFEQEHPANNAMWIVEGGHPDDSPYAPRDAWNEVRS